MSKIVNYIVIAAVVAIALFLTWYFSSIVAYLLISAVLALVAKPVVNFFRRLKVKGRHLPKWVCASAGLLTVWAMFFSFFYFFVPLVAEQFRLLATVDIDKFVGIISEPMQKYEGIIRTLFHERNFSFKAFLESRITQFFDNTSLVESFGSIANFLLSMAVAIFAISFITFFFMKEDTLFIDSLVIIFPAKYEQGIRHAWASSTNLLMRYFIGVIIDMLCILVVLTLGLKFIAGMDITTALLIGLIAGILNVIPYVGPLVAAGIGIVIAIAGGLETGANISHIVVNVVIVFAIVKILDDAVFQPLIFANSIKAHPLEIFLLILIAGSVAGIGGMLLAIPAYTIIRVFAKEFFNNLRVVQKLTGKI